MFSNMPPSQLLEFGPNGAVLNSPAMTDEMREKIAGASRAASIGDLPLKARLFRLISWVMLAFSWTVIREVPLWVSLIPIGVMTAEAFRNGQARKGFEPWFWRAAGILSLLWFIYCLVFWDFGETRP